MDTKFIPAGVKRNTIQNPVNEIIKKRISFESGYAGGSLIEFILGSGMKLNHARRK